MMWDPLALGESNLCGSNVHALVELHRVGVDNFGANLTCNTYGKITFPSCGCSANNN
jgi:hypothetical protein